MSAKPDFNALVLAMRAERSTTAMMVVYEHLFRLEEWFFPLDPEDPETPMQWRFPNGANPTPCILVYTEKDLAWARAREVAAQIGGSAGVLTLKVIDAVDWMRTTGIGVSWASVNFAAGFENFPLYFYQVEGLAQAFGLAAVQGR